LFLSSPQLHFIKMSTNTQRKGGKPTQAASGRVITRDKLVPAKVVVGLEPAIIFRPAEKPLKGALTVIISDGNHTRTLVIHHPVGITDLDGEDWVFSPVEDIPMLVARQVDPDAQRLAQLRALMREDLATKETPPLLVSKDGAYFYPTGESRSEIVRQARANASKADASYIDQWKKEGGEGEKPAKADYTEYFPTPELKAAERSFIEFSKKDSVKEVVVKKYPDNYRTMGGVNADIPQRGCTVVGRVPPPGQVFDSLVYQIANLKLLSIGDAKALVAGKALPEIPKAPAIPPRPASAGRGGGTTSTARGGHAGRGGRGGHT